MLAPGHQQGLATDPTNARAHNSPGNSLVRTGDLRGAEQCCRAAVQLAKLDGANENLALVLQMQKPAQGK